MCNKKLCSFWGCDRFDVRTILCRYQVCSFSKKLYRWSNE